MQLPMLVLIHTFVNSKDGVRGVKHQVDNRTRRDRVLCRNLAFTEQIPAMTDAYLIWSLEKSRMGFRSFFDQLSCEETNAKVDSNGGQWSMTVIDAFCKCLVASMMLAYYNMCSR